MSKQSRRPNRAARHQNSPPVGRDRLQRRQARLLWLGSLAVAAGLIAASFAVGRSGDANAAGPIEVGATAPRVVGTDVLTGRRIDSKDLAGTSVLYYLNEGVMCQACLVQIQALQQRASELRDRGLTLVSITNDDAATLRQAGRDYRITTPLIADEGRAIVKSFGVLGGIPAGVGMHPDTANHTFVLVDRRGRVRFIRDYPSMWAEVDDLLTQLPNVS